jgi:hypothetical protein
VLPPISFFHGFPYEKNTLFMHPASGGNFLDLNRKTLYELDFIENGVCHAADTIAR